MTNEQLDTLTLEVLLVLLMEKKPISRDSVALAIHSRNMVRALILEMTKPMDLIDP